MKYVNHGNVHFLINDAEKKLPIYLTNVGKWKNQYPISQKEGWHHYQWIQCTYGKGLLRLQEEAYEIEAGQGMLLYPHEFHEYNAIEEPWSVCWFSFNGKQVVDLLSYLNMKHSQVLHLSEPAIILNHFEHMFALTSSDSIPNYIRSSAVIIEILVDLHKYGTVLEAHSREDYFSGILPAIKYIEEHYHMPLTLSEIAETIGVSKQYTCTLFQQIIGNRPIQFLHLIRVRKAGALLTSQPHMSISEIAKTVGFDNVSYFNKIFRRLHGITPSKFRELM